MRDRFLRVPFASGGDTSTIPDATQPTGSISMQQGWGGDYQKEMGVDPGAKSVDRQDMNELFNIVTALLNRWQTESFPEWIDPASNAGTPYPYPKGAVVRYSATESPPFVAWMNTIDDNATEPSALNGWILFESVVNLATDPTETTRGAPFTASNNEALLGVNNNKMLTPANKKFSDQPTYLGNAVLTGLDNKLVMSGIVSGLSLEKGDVIEIDGAGAVNKKLRTVESITGNDQIVLNYEHCGSRGNGLLKLTDFTGQVTIKRIAKWSVASSGLGQEWVILTPFRSNGVLNTNSTGRDIEMIYTSASVASMGINFVTNGVIIADPIVGSGGGASSNIGASINIGIVKDSTYRVDAAVAVKTWSERR